MHAYGPTPEGDITRFEARHEIQLPASYRNYMRDIGGGAPERTRYFDELRGLELYVALVFALDHELMADQLFAFPPPKESGLLTVATNAGGNYFLISLVDGQIYYWNHELDDDQIEVSNLIWLASSIESLIQGLVYWPGEPEPVDALEELARTGTLDSLEEFVGLHGLTSTNSAGRTIAEESARHERLDFVTKCLELGAPLDNLLNYAAPGRNVPLIMLLLEKGAGINALNHRGESPLDQAIDPKVYALLEARGGKHVSTTKPPHLF